MDMQGSQIEQLLASGVLLVVILIALVISIGIWALIAWFLQSCLKRVPREHREMEPAMVWLLLIPCFNLVWNFFVFMKVPRSFKSYFDAQGITDVGDCGYAIGLAYAIAACLCVIPCVNYVAGPAALVLLIISLVKFSTLKNRLPVEPDEQAGFQA